MKLSGIVLAVVTAAALIICPFDIAGVSAGNTVCAEKNVKEKTDPATGISYSVSDGAVTVTGCDKKIVSLDIPEKIDGTPVIAIGDKAFEWHNKLKNVTIAEGITTIGQEAFSGCRFMTSLSIPTTVDTICRGAFDGCAKLKEFTVPKGVSVIEEGVFRGCGSLEKIILPEGIKEIREQGFDGCRSLNKLSIPSTVYFIGKRAFSNCYSLRQADIPYGVIGIGEYAFEGCQKLKTVSLPKSLMYIERGAFQHSGSLKEITLPDSLVRIDSFAFNDTGITKFNIPDNVEYVGTYACPSKAECEAEDGVKYIGKWAVGCEGTDNGIISVREGTVGIAEFESAQLSGNEYYVELPSTIRHICSPVLYSSSVSELTISEDNPELCAADSVIFSKDMRSLIIYPEFKTDESYTIPDTVTEICENAFSNNKKLKSVTIPDSVKLIGDHAFEKSGLTELKLPEDLTEIGEYAFSGLSGLKKPYNIDIPDSVVRVGHNAFAYSNCYKRSSSGNFSLVDDWAVGCEGALPNDKTLEIKDEIRGIADKAFAGSGFREMIIPDSVEYIGESSFFSCAGLEKAKLSKNLISIDDRAFSDCGKLKSMEIPRSVIHVGDNAFSGCSALLEEADGVQYADAWAVCSDKEIKKAVLRGGTRGIAESAFDSRTKLISAEMPDSLCYINSQAFAFCISLSDIKLPENLLSVDMGAFVYCISLNEADIPESTMYIDCAAFAECDRLSKINIHSEDCRIYDIDDTLPPNAIIYGHRDSTAESYSEKYGRVFIPLNEKCRVRGDVNSDGRFDASDLDMLKKWLNGEGELADWKAGDLYEDNDINVFDICAMRRELLN